MNDLLKALGPKKLLISLKAPYQLPPRPFWRGQPAGWSRAALKRS